MKRGGEGGGARGVVEVPNTQVGNALCWGFGEDRGALVVGWSSFRAHLLSQLLHRSAYRSAYSGRHLTTMKAPKGSANRRGGWTRCCKCSQIVKSVNQKGYEVFAPESKGAGCGDKGTSTRTRTTETRFVSEL